jgi:hypothetical protein
MSEERNNLLKPIHNVATAQSSMWANV